MALTIPTPFELLVGKILILFDNPLSFEIISIFDTELPCIEVLVKIDEFPTAITFGAEV